MKKLICILSVLAIAVCFSQASFAAEHPGTTGEHPGTTQKEHPGKGEICTSSQIIKAIREHINKVTRENNGVYPLYDSKEGKDLKLELIRVHEDKVSYIKKEDAYFACTDFIAQDEKTKYDVDFWMKKGKGKKLEVYQTKIHKKDGTPRFTYQDDEIVELEPAMTREEPTIASPKKRFIAPEAGT